MAGIQNIYLKYKNIHFRAAIEEKYAKDLLGLSKKVCGHSEMK